MAGCAKDRHRFDVSGVAFQRVENLANAIGIDISAALRVMIWAAASGHSVVIDSDHPVTTGDHGDMVTGWSSDGHFDGALDDHPRPLSHGPDHAGARGRSTRQTDRQTDSSTDAQSSEKALSEKTTARERQIDAVANAIESSDWRSMRLPKGKTARQYAAILVDTYPDCATPETIREAALWVLNNPKKAASKKYLGGFLTNWLKHERQGPSFPPPDPPRRAFRGKTAMERLGDPDIKTRDKDGYVIGEELIRWCPIGREVLLYDLEKEDSVVLTVTEQTHADIRAGKYRNRVDDDPDPLPDIPLDLGGYP